MSTNKTIAKPKSKQLFASGHRACAGCGEAIAAKTVAEALGPDVIIANATGCLEVTTSPFPQSSWGMPWIHSLFENAPAVASGILAALRQKGKEKDIKVVAQGGDGSTFDIGFGLLSGMWERGENIMYICYNNEAYANTGVQASGATPLGAVTTTTPSGSADPIGSKTNRKDMIAVALAHGLKYVAMSTAGYPDDIARKVKKAKSIDGPSYIEIIVPCVPGWHIAPDSTIKLAKLAAQTGLYPLLEYENGQSVSTFKVPQPAPKVDEYLKAQGRFKHLFQTEAGREELAVIQAIADANIEKYNLK